MITSVAKVDLEVVRGQKNQFKVGGTRNGQPHVWNTSGYSYRYVAKWDYSDVSEVILLSSSAGTIVTSLTDITLVFNPSAFNSLPYRAVRLQHELVFNDGTADYPLFVGELVVYPNVVR